jgi:PAS domain-containing protein
MMCPAGSTEDVQASSDGDCVDRDLYRRITQALPAHMAVIDADGGVVLVNDAWAEFAAANGGAGEIGVMAGANYLDVCRAAAAVDTHAAQALAGIEAVLAGRLPQFSMEYPCHSDWEQRWFLMTASPLAIGGGRGAVIAHVNISVGKEAEQALRASEIRFRALPKLPPTDAGCG